MNKPAVYLGKVSKIIMGQSPSSSSYSEEKKGLPFLQGCAEFGDKHPTPVKYCSTPLKVAPKGSVLVSVRAPVGDINIADQDYIIGRGLSAILAADINQDLLPYLLDFVKPQLRRVAQGSTFEAISFDDLDRCQLPDLGDEKEQAKIAEVLTAIDRAIAQTEALIAKHQRIKTGLMQDLLTRGIDEHGQLRDPSTHRFKSTPLGMIPEEWEVKELQECAKSTITYGIVQAGPHIIGGIPYIRSGDMMGEALSKENLLCTSPEIASRFKRSEVRAGEIVMSIRASVGQVLLVPKELDGANLTQGTARIAPKEKIHNEFLLWSIRSYRTQTEIDASTKGTTFKEISLATLRKVPVVIPASFDEQKQIANMLEKQVIQIKMLNVSLDKLHSLKTGLMQDLLSGRVSVKPLMEG